MLTLKAIRMFLISKRLTLLTRAGYARTASLAITRVYRRETAWDEEVESEVAKNASKGACLGHAPQEATPAIAPDGDSYRYY